MGRWDELKQVVETHAWLDLLVVSGSQAKGTARSSSDLDLGYLGNPTGSLLDFEGAIGLRMLRDVDLVSLDAQGATFSFEIARTGDLVFERHPALGPGGKRRLAFATTKWGKRSSSNGNWRGASGFRNRVAHAYETLDLGRLFRDLPGAFATPGSQKPKTTPTSGPRLGAKSLPNARFTRRPAISAARGENATRAPPPKVTKPGPARCQASTSF